MNRPSGELLFWRELTANPKQLEIYAHLLEIHDREIGSFLEIDPAKGMGRVGETEAEAADNTLKGLPFAVKDNIAVSGFNLTCGSKILETFNSPYDATAVAKLLKAGAIPVGKTNLDEFGMGSSTENSALKRTVNPWDHSRVPGGSSGGAAAAVAAGLVPFSLGSDTGGSVRQPAAYCGTYGLKPTYGSVSRFGLVAYASSLETVGTLANSVEMTRTVFNTIAGKDPFDQTSCAPADGYEDSSSAPYTVAVLKDIEGVDEATAAAYREMIEKIKSLGWSVKEVSLDTLEYVVPAYYTIATAEASANLARYTGIRYGVREQEVTDHEEMVRLTREHGFGDEVKLRVLLGTYVLRSGFQDQYYVRAQKIRTLIRKELETLFNEVDMMLMPVYPTQAFHFGGEDLTPFQQKVADKYTVTANLAGTPSLSIPAGRKNGLPVGLQLMGPVFSEKRLLDAAEIISGGSQIDLAPGALTPPGKGGNA